VIYSRRPVALITALLSLLGIAMIAAASGPTPPACYNNYVSCTSRCAVGDVQCFNTCPSAQSACENNNANQDCASNLQWNVDDCDQKWTNCSNTCDPNSPDYSSCRQNCEAKSNSCFGSGSRTFANCSKTVCQLETCDQIRQCASMCPVDTSCSPDDLSCSFAIMDCREACGIGKCE
jgi:hypothetical protein